MEERRILSSSLFDYYMFKGVCGCKIKKDTKFCKKCGKENRSFYRAIPKTVVNVTFEKVYTGQANVTLSINNTPLTPQSTLPLIWISGLEIGSRVEDPVFDDPASSAPFGEEPIKAIHPNIPEILTARVKDAKSFDELCSKNGIIVSNVD